MAELDWVSVRSVQRKSLVQITDENALDVIEAVGGAVYFDRGARRLLVGGTSREVGQWVDTGGTAWPDPYSEGASFVPDREIRHEDWCHTVTGCTEPSHCTCEGADREVGGPDGHRIQESPTLTGKDVPRFCHTCEVKIEPRVLYA